MDCDIAIAGGGPSGLMAAKTASEYGLKVILVDLKRDIPKYMRPCCAMWMTEPGYHKEYYHFQGNKIIFQENDFFVNYDGNYVDLKRSVRISTKGYTVSMGKKHYPIARVIEKEALLRGLLNEALKNGVEVRPQTIALGAEEGEKSVKLKVMHNGKKSQIDAKILLAADGVDSRIVESLGLNKERKIIYRTNVIAYHMANVKTTYNDAWVRFIGKGFTEFGGGGMLPKAENGGKETIFEIYGPPIYNVPLSKKEMMRRLLDFPLFKDWFREAELIDKLICRWTVWDPIQEPAKGKIIIVGDSASFQEVENQGALMCGYWAANASKEELEGRSGFNNYNRLWNKHFIFNDKKMLEQSCRGAWFRTLNDDEINYLYSLIDGIMIDGYINHFSSGENILLALRKYLDRIKKERPDIATKMEEFYKLSPEDFFPED